MLLSHMNLSTWYQWGRFVCQSEQPHGGLIHRVELWQPASETLLAIAGFMTRSIQHAHSVSFPIIAIYPVQYAQIAKSLRSTSMKCSCVRSKSIRHWSKVLCYLGAHGFIPGVNYSLLRCNYIIRFLWIHKFRLIVLDVALKALFPSRYICDETQ